MRKYYVPRRMSQGLRREQGALLRKRDKMSEVKEWRCPYYDRVIDEYECLDMYLIASRAIKDEKIVKEEDRNALFAMCQKCRKHGIIEGKQSLKQES